MVRSAGRCVSTGLQVVVNFQQTSKREIVVLIMCSILMAYLLVMAVIVVLIKNRAQREYYMSTLVSLKVVFFLSFIKNKG